MSDNSQDNSHDERKGSAGNGGQDDGSQDSGSDDNGSDSSDDKSPVPPSIIGWIVRFASLALIAALIVFLVFKASGENDRFDYAINPKWEEAQPGPDGRHLVPIEITNKSSRAIRNWQIELSQEGGEPVMIEMRLVGAHEKMTYVVELDALYQPIETTMVFYEK